MKKRLFIWITLIVLLPFIAFNKDNRNYLKELALFSWTFVKKPSAVGAVAPSSPFLAKAIIKKIKRSSNEPIRVLEVGAGTGVITDKLLEIMKDGDILDVVELQPNFCEILKEKFKHKNVTINCLSILDWNPPYKYDFLVSGIPFNSCTVDFLKKVFNKYLDLVKKGGMISYFEYFALAKIKLFFLNEQSKLQYSKIISTVVRFRNKFLVKKKLVLLNFPPAYIYYLRIN